MILNEFEKKGVMPLTEGVVPYYITSAGAGWSSPVARRAHNPEVAGSNPVPATKQEVLETGPFLFVWAAQAEGVTKSVAGGLETRCADYSCHRARRKRVSRACCSIPNSAKACSRSLRLPARPLTALSFEARRVLSLECSGRLLKSFLSCCK